MTETEKEQIVNPTANATRTAQLSDAGVSIWLDDLSRERLSSGSLQKLIDQKNVVGVTTNPSIFQAAITSGTDYDAKIAELAAEGATLEETIFEITTTTTTDVADACDLFAPVAAATKGVDGRVSIEVDPRLAWDTAGTIAEAKHLYKKVNKDNVHIKIPATLEGLEAITATLAEGISVNVTLIFSLERYRAVVTERWAVLADASALPQRPLWASTGVKDPAYPDTLYVTGLVAAGVVNTMPEKTLDATFDHGVGAGDTITGTYTEAHATLDALEKLGISYDEVVALLESEGLDKFVASWKELLADVEGALAAARKEA